MSLANYTRKCKITQGKIVKAYLMEYAFYNETLIKSEGMRLTQFPRTIIYTFDCEGDYSQTTQSEAGNVSFNQTINIRLPIVYNTIDAHLFIEKDHRVIVETNNNELILFGTNNGLTGSENNTSGTTKPEFNGFLITFTGLEEKTALIIDELTDYFTPVGTLFGFNYNLNSFVHG